MAKKKKDVGIVYKPIGELIPYEKNPRKNEKAVKYVANSIKEFGFKVPCVIDKNNVVITGHTRLKAAKKLGIKDIPCIIADDLTDEQVKAFRLADNSVAEYSEWDWDLLAGELEELLDLDYAGSELDGFGFLVGDDGLEFEVVEEEIQTETFNYENYQKARFEGVGEYDIPPLKPLLLKDYVDTDFIPFSDLTRSIIKDKRSEFGVHFFIQDHTFQSVWTNIDRYKDRLLQHSAVITPDFSMYVNFPKALRIWNHYRNMWVGAYLQSMGAKVIPNIGASVDGNEWFLDGMPKGGVVAYSTHGAIKYDDSRDIIVRSYYRMIEELEPKGIVWFGGVPKEIELPSDIKIFKKDPFPLKKFYKKNK